jgi:TfoX/Sxy family transcriptional regulator of competence genes
MPEMPKFTKSSPEIVERFGAVMDRYPDVERRKMFGYPAAFVGGNMATGLFADQWIVRLSDAELAAATGEGALPFEVMPGRTSKGFVALPPAVVADDRAIGGWVERALAFASGLPPKELGARKKKG